MSIVAKPVMPVAVDNALFGALSKAVGEGRAFAATDAAWNAILAVAPRVVGGLLIPLDEEHEQHPGLGECICGRQWPCAFAKTDPPLSSSQPHDPAEKAHE